MKTVFTNAVFHTMESEGDVCGTIVVEDGVICALDAPAGSRGELDVDALELAGARVVDLGGRHAYPALIDSHLHLLDSVALDAVGVPVCRVEDGRLEPHDLAGVEALVRAHLEHAKPGALAVFTSCVPAALDEGRLPTRSELDEWSGGGEVWMMNIDGHSSAGSTAFLKAVGLADAAPESGLLSGALHDANLGVITEHLSASVTPSLLGSGIAHFCNECASFGIGTVCALEGNDDIPRDRMTELIARLARKFPLDVRLFPEYMDEAKREAVNPLMGAARVGGCGKWELDGSVGSHSAAFRTPYNDGSRGELYFPTEQLEETVSSLAARGFQVSAHAIGEEAIDQLVGIYGRLPEDMRAADAAHPRCPRGADDAPAPCRHRIDHCEFPSPDAVRRICELKPFVTVQPGYSWMDKRYLHGYEHDLPAATVAQQVPLRTLASAGVALLGSSDSPVQSVDPFLQMRGMREFYVEEQSLSAFEALCTYTVNGGRALGEKKGLLREGYEASFFTLDDDLLTMPLSGLEGLHACELYLHGKLWKPMPEGLRAFGRLAATRARSI